MADEQNPYLAVLADLERERDQINGMIALIRKRAGLSSEEPVAGTSPNGTGPHNPESFELRSDTFFGMVISDAIKKYLNIVKRPRRTAEIAHALEEGGLQHTSKRWFATVQTTLNRMQGVVVKLPNGWGLLEWYPGRNFEKKTFPKRKRRRSVPTKTRKTSETTRPSRPHASSKSTKLTLTNSRELQGKYLAMLKQVPADKREAYKSVARESGREAAIEAIARDLGL